MHTLYLSLGSNLGDRQTLVRQALRLLDERLGHLTKVSSLSETKPWGFTSSNMFINAVCCLETELPPRECLHVTQQIERELGRTSKSTDGTYHDRPIDIDLLTYDDIRVDEPGLVLPHPHMQERDFVMVPLKEILPQ